jgi:hypothetical protein
MRNHQQSGKTKQNDRSSQWTGGEFDDEDRDSGGRSNFGSSNDNRRHQNRDDEGRFTDERHNGDRPQDPSRSPSSNFGDDEIGGTSFDPRPVHSETRRRDERTVKKARGNPAATENKK